MTLIVSVATRDYVVQVSDMRLTDERPATERIPRTADGQIDTHRLVHSRSRVEAR